MIPFVPSPEFSRFFDAIIAAAEAPVTGGSYAPTIPTFADPREQAFAQTKLAALITQIDLMKKSVIPPAPVSGQATWTEEQVLWQQASSGAP